MDVRVGRELANVVFELVDLELVAACVSGLVGDSCAVGDLSSKLAMGGEGRTLRPVVEHGSVEADTANYFVLFVENCSVADGILV